MKGNISKSLKKASKPKLLIFSVTVILVLFSIVGGTIAWLIADTAPVVNTFTYGDINITLEETDTKKDNDNDPNTNDYPMLPGNTIEKDPKVTVIAKSENAWLFVKLEKTSNFDDFLTFEMADGWTKLENVDGVYYRTVDKSDTDTSFYVIKDNTVTVKGEVTKEMLNALDSGATKNYPKLTITAYAVQRDNNISTASDAWSKIPAPTNP